MTSSARLGGFKILKNVTRISVVSPKDAADFPVRFCRLLSGDKINLPYFTAVFDGETWGLHIVVEAHDEERVFRLIKERCGEAFAYHSGSAVLSIFPHKRNPEITGRLFEVFEQEGLEPDALANSPSAISIVLKEDLINKASKALFEPFSFSAYRTPADWKLAQEGKEQLYKEVVASYQEQRPKVYGLGYYEGQEFLQMTLNRNRIGNLGTSFIGFARLGLNLTFLASGPCRDEGEMLAFSLATTQSQAYTQIIKRIAPEIKVRGISPVTVFSMNGPHFGDRYGIASELLTAFESHGIDLVGLSCTIASVSGVVPSHQLERTIEAVRQCFDVPSISKGE